MFVVIIGLFVFLSTNFVYSVYHSFLFLIAPFQLKKLYTYKYTVLLNCELLL